MCGELGLRARGKEKVHIKHSEHPLLLCTKRNILETSNSAVKLTEVGTVIGNV